MKKVLCSFLLLYLIVACSENKSNEVDISDNTIENQELGFADSVRTKRTLIPRFDYTDTNGLKQGIWITRGYKNRLKRIETFVNDTLHGYWFEESGGFQLEGYYKIGVKEGCFWRYRLSQDRFNKSAYNFDIYQQFFYDNDEISWSISPETDMGYLIPIRGLTSNHSIYAKAIYKNGAIWYEGAYDGYESVGVHKIYFPNGKLFGEVDYNNDVITEYDSLGNFVRTENIHFYNTNRGERFK